MKISPKCFIYLFIEGCIGKALLNQRVKSISLERGPKAWHFASQSEALPLNHTSYIHDLPCH
uniref:Secreted protein n=1 Tax=Heterorhabditis bacteriophora TaxID=37862 RepID=A0A1I7WQK1_HETBA